MCDHSSANLRELCELIQPNGQVLLQTLDENGSDAFLQVLNPLAQVAEVVEVELIKDLLNLSQPLLKCLSLHWACCHLIQILLNLLSFFNCIIDCILKVLDGHFDLFREFIDPVLVLPVDVEPFEQVLLRLVLLKRDQLHELVGDLGVGVLEGAEGLLDAAGHRVQLLQVVQLVGHGDARAQAVSLKVRLLLQDVE